MAKKKSGAARHVHKYILKDVGINKEHLVYACALPDCTHYLQLSMALGKSTICWKCLKECKLDAFTVSRRRVKPRCPPCRGDKPEEVKIEVKKELEAIDLLLKMRM